MAKPIGTAKGTLGNKEMTLSEVKDWFLTYKNNFNYSGKGTDKEFCLLANGFWQAEGYIGGIFRSELNFYPLCTATQLLSEECVKFFLRLDKSLSNKGTFSILRHEVVCSNEVRYFRKCTLPTLSRHAWSVSSGYEALETMDEHLRVNENYGKRKWTHG